MNARIAPLFTGGLVAAIAGALAIASSKEVLGQRLLFAIMTVLLLTYLAVEVARLRRLHPERWLVNPIVMASVISFGISFGLTNILFFMPAESIRSVGLSPEVSPAMVKLMWLVVLAAVAMWLGYWSPLAARLSGPAMRMRASRWVRSAPTPHKLAIPALAGIAFVAKLLQVRLGLFGYSGSYDQVIASQGYSQYLGMLSSLGLASLVLAALVFYERPGSALARKQLIAIFLMEVAFGFLSGFKSQVAMPFVVVGVCRYIKTGRIPVSWMAGFMIAIAIAYAVIEPFRDARRMNAGFRGDSFGEIAGVMIESQASYGAGGRSHAPTWLSAMARSSLVRDGSMGIKFKDAHGELPEGSPEFLKNMLLAPVYAWVPRVIMPSKPLGNLGLWYTRVVIGHNVMSSTASGPVTYLYFAGGSTAVVALFLLLGIMQRMVFFLLDPANRTAGAFMLLALLPTLTIMPSAVDGMIVDLFRTVPILVVLQITLFRRRSYIQANSLGKN